MNIYKQPWSAFGNQTEHMLTSLIAYRYP